jgi:hypothetical protein
MKHCAQDGTMMLEIDDQTGKAIWYTDISGNLLAPETELCEMCLRSRSDKCGNGYTAFYDKYFSPIRRSVNHILELGVMAGSSLQMWEEYFPNALILGLDNGVHPNKMKELSTGRVLVEFADQNKKENILGVTSRHGTFDIIVDDCSHFTRHQQSTLGWLFPAVRAGGFYVVEDIPATKALCNNEIGWGQRDRVNGTDCTAYCLDNMSKGIFQSEYMSEKDVNYLKENVEWVKFCFGTAVNTENITPHNWGGPMTCLIKKRAK